MNNFKKNLSNSLLAGAVLLAGATPAWAQVSLGDASDFSVLAATVTCTTSVIAGDVGIAPATAFTNTGCTITGAMPPATNTAALAARADFLSAYADMQLLTSSCIPVPGNLSGVELAPGVYCLDAVAKAGTLTLTGPSTGEWIFLVNGALTGTDFAVVMAGGAEACNVYWAPTGAATMTTSSFKGNILAGAPATAADPGSITLTGGTLAGSVLANVAVTMTNASVVGCDVLSPSPSCKPKKHHDKHHGHDKDHKKCNQGVGNGSESCDPGHSNHHNSSNDENGGKPGKPGRQGK